MQEMFSSLLAAWARLSTPYKAGGCILMGLALMWKATDQNSKEDRMFFVSGLLSLALLAYGATLFVNSGAE